MSQPAAATRPNSVEERSASRQFARLVTEVLAPSPIAVVMLALVAWTSADTRSEAIRWGLVAILFAPVVPFIYLIRQVRKRRVTDHHVKLREQRPKILIVGTASVLLALALMVALGAPRELTAVVGSGAAGLLAAIAITLSWKISIHVGTVAGTLVVLVMLFGREILLLSPLVPLVGWARVKLGDHTPPQVIGGAVIGGLVTVASFSALMGMLG
ncbi:MAG: phosphatase PAP2 family protein [Chloroflexota bacterium]|nr:phosphatase PAP2 family protein [Chloroflexota bacterium]